MRGEDDGPILMIRLSAMGDILHTLPAATTLKTSFPKRELQWLVAPRWASLLEGNPYVDKLVIFDRGALGRSWREVRAIKPGLALDFQGLVQSALVGRATGAPRLLGFDRTVARESLAAVFYTDAIRVKGPHRVQRNVQLAAAAGASHLTHESWIPPGSPEGELPAGPFVLTSPFAGWAGKEWPLTYYEALGRLLRQQGLELVANVSPHGLDRLRGLDIQTHVSGLAGLIDATRRATAVVGLDSGPVHLAAALKKPGVALYGPTDPALTGPFGGSMTVLRAANAETTYKRRRTIQESMTAISPTDVAAALLASISAKAAKSAEAVAVRS